MKKKFKYSIFILLFVILLNGINFEKILAASNTEYYNPQMVERDQIGSEGAFESIVDFIVGDIILENIGKFILSLSTIVETLVTNFSKWLFGVNAFPWEDYIVYNSLPYLDINFFNYSNGSIFSIGDVAKVGDLVRTIYFTLLTLAIGLLGLGVAVTAVRLSISTIAAEKAKYKEAITKCLYTVIMLFSVHFLISFIFYTNETIVKASSEMLSSLISDEEQKRIEDAIKSVDTSKNTLFVVVNGYPTPDNPSLLTIGSADVGFLKELFGGESHLDRTDEFLDKYVEICDSDEMKAVFAYLIGRDGYLSKRTSRGYYIAPDTNEMQNKKWWKSENPEGCHETLEKIFEDIDKIKKAKTNDELKASYSSSDINSEWYKYVNEAFETYKGLSSGSLPNIISSLGNYFRDQAKNTSTGDLNYVAILLYAILIVQSIMLLISYIKRIFYVTLLSLLAPIVIIYDFFMSSI